MKIAFVNLITRTPLGGLQIPKIVSNKESMIVRFTNNLNMCLSEKIDLFIADAYKPISSENLKINIFYLPTRFKTIFLPTLIPFTPNLFLKLRNNYDVCICSEIFQLGTILAVLAKIFSFKKKMKIIVWQEMAAHQRMFKKIPSIFFHKFILKVFLDKFISLYIPRGTRAKNFLISQKINQNKITNPISHGVDQAYFYYDPHAKKENYIFSPSRLVSSKGINMMLNAFAIVHKRNNRINLVIQGEGPGLNEYERLAKKLNIEKNVFFCTLRATHDEMRVKYQKALATVICSTSDLMIFSAMESVACGTPLIVSKGADIYAEFENGKDALIFEKNDHIQLASFITQIIEDESLRAMMVKNTLEKARFFQQDHLVKKFKDIILQ